MPNDVPAAPMPPPAFDDILEFSARLRVSPRTTRRLIDKGLPVIKIGDLTRIDPEPALDWVRNSSKPRPVRRGRPAKKASR
jgi:hypothetical protein